MNVQHSTNNAQAIVKMGWDAAAAGDARRAEMLWREAADLGDADALCFLAINALRRNELQTAQSLYREAAQKGNLTAIVMAEMPMSDEDLNADDPFIGGFRARRAGDFSTMRTCWETAALSADPFALFAAGLAAYEAEDDERAQEYWMRAASSDDGRGAWALGVLYAEIGDETRSAEWTERAQRLGFPAAL